MHVPEFIKQNATYIRALDPTPRAVPFDKPKWRRTFETFKWELPAEVRRRLIAVLDEIPGDVLTADFIQGNNQLWIPKPMPAHVVFCEDFHQLSRLFLLTSIWTYGLQASGPMQTARFLNDRGRRGSSEISTHLYYGRLDFAYYYIKFIAEDLKPAFATNALYFLTAATPSDFFKPVIYEPGIIKTLRAIDPLHPHYLDQLWKDDLTSVDWPAYSHYITLLHNWAVHIGCTADQIAEFIRLKGLELAGGQE